jgi:heat shock protein HslJ
MDVVYMLKIILLPIAALVILGLTACTSAESDITLTNQPWLLTELVGQVLLPDTVITANFSPDGMLSGASGCNNYSGPYVVDGQDIRTGPFASTMMACPEPVMGQEILYIKTMENSASFSIQGDTLTFNGPGGDPLAVFTAVSQDLAGSSWDVISYNNGKGAVVSVIIGTEISANFGEDGQLTGSAGCNDYFAPYETGGDEITIGLPGATEKFCSEPDGIMEQEQAYLAALQTAATYNIQAADMDMRTAEGARVAFFKRKPSR